MTENCHSKDMPILVLFMDFLPNFSSKLTGDILYTNLPNRCIPVDTHEGEIQEYNWFPLTSFSSSNPTDFR